MKTIFITYDQANHDNVLEVLDRSNVRGYTLLEQVKGRGSKTGNPHMGSHAWPTMNSAIITVVDDDVVDILMQRLKEVDTDNEMLGLRAFVWNVEMSI